MDFFGIEKRAKLKLEQEQTKSLEAEKEKVLQDIQDLKRKLSEDTEADSSAYLQNWDKTQERTGRNPAINYRQLEWFYKQESWVRAAIDAIQRTSVSNGFRLVATDDDIELTKKETAPILKIFENPNADDTFPDIVSEIIVDLHLYGDAYVEIVKDKQGIPIGMFNVYAPSVRILVNQTGKVLGYLQVTQTGSAGTKPVFFAPDEIVHFKLPNPGNEVYGLSPLESLALPLQTDILAQVYNKTFFENNATPRLHLDLGNCSLPQLKRMREYFRSEFKGAGNAHKTFVTEGGAQLNVIGTSSSDMEFLNQRKFSRDEILAVFGVPPMKVGITEDVNRACFPENTLVATPYGYKKIKDVKKGETVYSYDNRNLVERKVANAFSKGKKKLYELRLNDRKVEATDNHPFLVVTPYKEKYRFGGKKRKTLYKLEWKPLKDLKNGEFIACIDKTQPKKSRRVFKHNIPLTEDFLELIGLYIGDGSITKNNQGKLSEISWAIEHDAEIRGYYEELAEKVFDTHINKNNHVFRMCSIKWGKIFEDLDLAHNVYNKVIPEWVWGLDHNLKMAFFRGLIESDGTVSKRGAISYSGCNENLVKQIKLFAMDLGIPSTNLYKMERNNDDKGFKTDKPLYRVTFENHDVNKTLTFRTTMYNDRIQAKGKAKNMYKSLEYKEAQKYVGDGFVVRRVKDIKYTREDIIYDLEVEDTHCFIAEGMVVHNSALESDKSFKSDKIIPLQRMISKKINQCVVALFNNSRVKFEFVELDLRDAKEQSEIDKLDIESGIMTVNEVRKRRGLPPISEEASNDINNRRKEQGLAPIVFGEGKIIQKTFTF